MKKLFKKPVMDVLYFDEEDTVLCSTNAILSSSETDSNTEIASEGLDTSVFTVEKASAIFD